MAMSNAERLRISTFWLSCMSLLLALAYVLPNHYLPWPSFHAEAWSAVAIAVPGIWIAWRARHRTGVYASTLMVALAATGCFLQYVFGLIHFLGTFWISASYLVGFLLTLQLGELWEREARSQCLDYLAISLVLASLLSLPIELIQWLNIPWSSAMLISAPDIHRPTANMAQPNLLADLYLLGVIGLSWLHSHKRLPGLIALVLIALFLGGAALTGSRTAWLNVIVLVIFSTIGQPRLEGSARRRAALALAAYFFVCVAVAPLLQAVLLDTASSEYSTASAHSRLAVWKMMFAASQLSPWWGYGWGQVIKANFTTANATGVGELFSQSHNFFLDLVLWNGYPLGLLLALGLGWWIWRLLRIDRNLPQWHTLVFLAVLCVHAIVEYPFCYAYFLFPMGLLLGSVQPIIAGTPFMLLSRNATRALLALGIVMLSVSIRDYFLIERSFYALRFESRGILTDIPRSPPDAWVLTQMVAHLRFSRDEPAPLASPEEFEQMEDVVRVTPSPHTMLKLALNYALAGNTGKATFWLKQICDKTVDTQCAEAKQKWELGVRQNKYPHLMPWPIP